MTKPGISGLSQWKHNPLTNSIGNPVTDKKILNNTARSYNLKPTCNKKGRFNVTLIPGINVISADLYKLVKAMKYCKDLAEEGILDFNPKKVKKGTPVSNAITKVVKDPTKELGSKGKDKEEETDDDAEDEEYQAYLKECAEDEEDEDDEPMTYAEWLAAE